MKTLVRTIALIAVISLGCICLSGEPEKIKEKVKDERKAAKLEDALHALEQQKEVLKRNEEQLTRQLMELGRQVEVTMPIPAIPPVPAATRTSGIVLTSGLAGDSADISIIITSEDDQPESISQVTEDMGIMARILDKQVLEIPRPQPRQTTFGDRSFYYVQTGASQQNRTRGIYISGYGALFLMDIDFPLKPELKAEEKEEKKAEVGDIWEQTKDELTGMFQGFGPDEPETKRDKQKVAFDEDKVKELKEKIIKALKYASNIRGLEPGDDIIVAVKSTIQQDRGRIREINIYGSRIGMQTSGISAVGKTSAMAGGFAEEKEPDLITGMTIMVSKDDVDSLAEGDVNYDEFLKDVEIFEY